MKDFRVYLCLGALAWAAMAAAAQQDQSGGSMSSMPGMDMSSMDHSKMTADPGAADLGHSMEAMSMKHMDMGPHMKMTELRPLKPGDKERADRLAATLRSAIEKYKDVRVAEADGFKEHNPNVPTPMKHFTNFRYALKAQFTFDPTEPTSLLYEKHGDQYKLIGAMYTAPKRYTEDDLDKRVPLSVAQWHEHVDLCMPPRDRRREMFGKNARFGFNGSITSEAECTAAGGKFYPVIYSWMVHVYPFEKTPEEIWSVERGRGGHGHAD